MTQPDRTKEPETHSVGRLTMPQVRRLSLDNGARLVIYDGGQDAVNRLTVAVRGGEAESTPECSPALMSALTLEGTALLSSAEIADKFDYNGSWTASGVALHHTHRTFFSLNRCMDNVAPVIASVISNPSFPDHEVAIAREKAARELELKRERVTWHASRALDLMLAGEGSAVTVAYTPEQLRAMTSGDLRTAYYSRLRPSAVTAYLAGRITSAVEETVISLLGSVTPCSDATPLTVLPLTTAPEPPSTRRIERPGALQSAIAAGIPAIGRTHPDYELLRLAVVVLGGYFGSRLMSNIREDKGYTYGIGASLQGYRENGFVKIQTECDNRYVGSVLDEVRRELVRMQDPASYTAEEMQRCKSFMLTTLCSQLDSPFAVVDYYQNYDFIGAPEGYFERQQRSLELMTPELMADISRRYLDPDALRIAVAGA